MRLITTLDNAQQAERFSLFLLERGIEHQVETKAENQHIVWVFNEDCIAKSKDCLEEFLKLPNWTPSPEVIRKKREEELQKEAEQVLSQDPEEFSEESLQRNSLEENTPEAQGGEETSVGRKKSGSFGKLTLTIVFACIMLFMWSSFSAPAKIDLPDGEALASSSLFTTPYNRLTFENPLAYQYASEFLEKLGLSGNAKEYMETSAAYNEMHQFQTTPYWHGYYETYLIPEGAATFSLNKAFTSHPVFEQIAQGEVWRVFTPALLHANLFHILFNLIWFVFLGKQIEQRLGFWRFSFFVLFAAALSNSAQYLMSGPNFLGLSGVIMAMAGYVWMRQSIAAWEGYTIQKPTLYFLGFYVLVLVLLQIASFVLERNGYKSIAPNIANTAHVVGAIVGVTLGRLNFLSAWRLGKIKK
ncbi:MAG: Rhomboid protease GlpG [Chlamydiae bacterium]|nr:Rhomboid protease GlpG [Chlamydiota bacterium]